MGVTKVGRTMLLKMLVDKGRVVAKINVDEGHIVVDTKGEVVAEMGKVIDFFPISTSIHIARYS